MIIEGKVNLVTCKTEILVELKEALDIALKQRVKALKKKSRSDNTFAQHGMTDLEKELIGIIDKDSKSSFYTVEDKDSHTMSHMLNY